MFNVPVTGSLKMNEEWSLAFETQQIREAQSPELECQGQGLWGLLMSIPLRLGLSPVLWDQ